MALQLIGAGLGRTGTNSLKLALEQLLGGPCYHMFEVPSRPDDADVWAAAYDGRPPDWSTFFAPHRAAVDWPVAPFWAELADVFPDAVILLSERDPDSWWTSASNTIWPAAQSYERPDVNDDSWKHFVLAMMDRFTPDWHDEQAAKAAFVAWNEHVKAAAPADRLVVWRAGDGWAPICRALGVAEPDEPFPHTNTTAETRGHLGLDG